MCVYLFSKEILVKFVLEKVVSYAYTSSTVISFTRGSVDRGVRDVLEIAKAHT